jgi:hypothetical protein
MEFVVSDIADKNQWKQIVDNINAEYYYIDEPYTMGHHSDDELIQKLNYITSKRPSSKFVIGDIRVIQEKKYIPIPGLNYVYTSYTNNWLIPILDKCIPIGGPNQSPSIKRIYKKTRGAVPWIWVYGQNKIFCHPDEYHKIFKTAEELKIDILFLYISDGITGDNDKYRFNVVSKCELWDNINHFIKNEKPYTLLEWWKRFFYRLSLSFKYLFRTWDFKDFINTLF